MTQATGTLVVISAHPVTRRYRERLEDAFGRAEYVSVAHLRRLPKRQLLRVLRGYLGAHCLLPVEDQAARALLPLVETVALATAPRSIRVVDPELRAERVSHARALASPLTLVTATANGRSAVRHARNELAALTSLPVEPYAANDARSLLYLHATPWPARVGGAVAHVAGVANALSDSGYAVDLAAVASQALLAPGVRHLALPPLAGYALPADINYYRFHRDAVKHLLAERCKYSLIYQRMTVGNYAGVTLSRRWRVPLVLEYNGSELWVAGKWAPPLSDPELARRAEEVSLRHAHVVVTVSDVLRQELLERGVDDERIALHPNGVDAARFDPALFDEDAVAAVRDRYGFPGDAVVATFVGTFGPWHGVDVFADAIRMLVDEQRELVDTARVRFLLVGDGVAMADVRTRLRGYEGYAALAGMIEPEEMPLHLAASDLLVAPHRPNPDASEFFGSPTKLFEYMASGRAIVASNLGQIGTVLADGLRANALPSGKPTVRDASAVLTDPGSASELATAVRFLAENNDWRDSLGTRARELVLERYTWDAHVSVVLERVRRLV